MKSHNAFGESIAPQKVQHGLQKQHRVMACRERVVSVGTASLQCGISHTGC